MQILVGIIAFIVVIALIVEYWAYILAFVVGLFTLVVGGGLIYKAIPKKIKEKIKFFALSRVTLSLAFWSFTAIGFMKRFYFSDVFSGERGGFIGQVLIIFIGIPIGFIVTLMALWGIVSGLYMVLIYSIGNIVRAFCKNVKFRQSIENNRHVAFYISAISYAKNIVCNVGYSSLKSSLNHGDF